MEENEKQEQIEKEPARKSEQNENSAALPLGMCLGLAIGTAVGAATGNLGLWMPLGLCLGLTLGSALGAEKKKDKNGDDKKD